MSVDVATAKISEPLTDKVKDASRLISSQAPPVGSDDEVDGVDFYIVGDRFGGFSDNNTILTYSEAIEHISILAKVGKRVVLGQGISVPEAQELRLKLGLQCGWRRVHVMDHISQKVSKSLVGKTDEKNVLITHPRKSGPLRYCSDLIVDDDCGEMTDCRTGQHLQGLLLIEAARQLFMVCALIDVLPEFFQEPQDLRFTLSSMDIRFECFVFPVAANLTLQLSNIQRKDAFASGTAQIKVVQFNRVCAEMKLDAVAYTDSFFSSLETRNAIKARRRLLVQTAS